MRTNLAHLLQRTARHHPGLPAVARGDSALHDFASLARRVGRLARGLREGLGLKPDDRVALVMRNCPQYLELLLACWHAGLAAVPVNAKLHPRELEFIFADTAAAACFVTADLAEGVATAARAATGPARIVDVDSADYGRLFADASLSLVERDADAAAWLFYTSGTTGKPKGVVLTQRNLVAATLAYFSDVDHIAAGDAILHAAPMSHGSGLYILPHLARGACQVIPESGAFEPAEIFAAACRWPGLSMFAAPTMVKRLVDFAAEKGADPAGLKTVVYGGGPMYVEDIKRAMAVLGNRFAQIYGQGESPMTITAMDKAAHAVADDAMLASVGRPYLGVEVLVADAAGRPLPPGGIGEILVRGDTVMAGYLNNPEATAKTLAGGWLHTGDMGCFDERGFLTLKDRSKDLIISGGSNIYPREVEEVLLRHPGVAEVSVVGAPDPEWGEIVVAFVVRRPAAAVHEGDLDALCLDHIARFKRPKRYRFVEGLPKNATGKVLKTELRRAL
ncbi:MAG: AMP-binding protein [Rhodocyclaceae bacterium]|nr:AMP-binding protein [Rhodocyclaceae bacterium]